MALQNNLHSLTDDVKQQTWFFQEDGSKRAGASKG